MGFDIKVDHLSYGSTLIANPSHKIGHLSYVPTLYKLSRTLRIKLTTFRMVELYPKLSHWEQGQIWQGIHQTTIINLRKQSSKGSTQPGIKRTTHSSQGKKKTWFLNVKLNSIANKTNKTAYSRTSNSHTNETKVKQSTYCEDPTKLVQQVTQIAL